MKKNKIGVLSYLSMFIVQCCPSIFVSTSPSLDETALSSLSFLYNNTISLLNQLVTTEPPNHLVRACLVITYHMWLEWVSEREVGVIFGGNSKETKSHYLKHTIILCGSQCNRNYIYAPSLDLGKSKMPNQYWKSLWLSIMKTLPMGLISFHLFTKFWLFATKFVCM